VVSGPSSITPLPTCKLSALALTPSPNCAEFVADAVMAADVQSPQAKEPAPLAVVVFVTARPPAKAPAPEAAIFPLLVHDPVANAPAADAMIDVPVPEADPDAKAPSPPVARMIPIFAYP